MVVMVIGLFILPIILRFTPEKEELRWLNSVYGNAQDGTGWDFGSNPAITQPDNWFTRKFPRYYWLTIRNAAHNLSIRLAGNGVVEEVFRSKPNPHTRGKYYAWVKIDGLKYHFYYGVFKYPFVPVYFRYAFGTKIWGSVKAGDVLTTQGFAISVLPFISKKTAGLG